MSVQVNKALPWASVMTVGLLIAKYGFGASISLLWCLAPLWIPLAVGSAVALVAGVIAVFGALLVATVGYLGAPFRKRTGKRHPDFSPI